MAGRAAVLSARRWRPATPCVPAGHQGKYEYAGKTMAMKAGEVSPTSPCIFPSVFLVGCLLFSHRLLLQVPPPCGSTGRWAAATDNRGHTGASTNHYGRNRTLMLTPSASSLPTPPPPPSPPPLPFLSAERRAPRKVRGGGAGPRSSTRRSAARRNCSAPSTARGAAPACPKGLLRHPPTFGTVPPTVVSRGGGGGLLVSAVVDSSSVMAPSHRLACPAVV